MPEGLQKEVEELFEHILQKVLREEKMQDLPEYLELAGQENEEPVCR